MGFKNDGLQVAEYEWDFAVDGGATGVIDLSAKAGAAVIPVGGIVQQAVCHVVTAATSGGAASAIIGPTADTDKYLPIQAVASLSLDAVFDYTTVFAVDAANKGDVLLTISGAALTAGKIKVMVEYLLHS